VGKDPLKCPRALALACESSAAQDMAPRHTRGMRLYPEEPEASSWEPLDDVELAVRLRALLPAEMLALVLVDGRSGSGKSTFTERLARLLDGAVVHSDDIAWHHDPIQWADALIDGVITPWRRGEAVSFRPPGWVVQGRPGAVEVPPRPVLIVEGVGAGRSGLAALAELVVWVQSDRDEARRRGLQRDVELGRTPKEAEAFWDEWMRTEEPFLADDRPWSRACLVVNGTPQRGMQADSVLAPGPLDA
jgi:hypothetical protein